MTKKVPQPFNKTSPASTRRSAGILTVAIMFLHQFQNFGAKSVQLYYGHVLQDDDDFGDVVPRDHGIVLEGADLTRLLNSLQ